MDDSSSACRLYELVVFGTLSLGGFERLWFFPSTASCVFFDVDIVVTVLNSWQTIVRSRPCRERDPFNAMNATVVILLTILHPRV